MYGVKGNIEGVDVVPLIKILDERGCIYKITSKKDNFFISPKEVYVSLIYPNTIKAWHKHNKMNLFYSPILGNIKIVLYDNRKNSKTNGNIMEIFMGEENPISLIIPKKYGMDLKVLVIKKQ